MVKKTKLAMSSEELRWVARQHRADGDDLQHGDGLMTVEDLGVVAAKYKRADYLDAMAQRGDGMTADD